MSRVSQKSGLSPSITKGSNAIDLGKNSGVDMGRKSQPSITSGGIGVTQEVTHVGGVSVSAGANIDITPLDFGISIDPSEGTVSVATGAEIPGCLLGISGGIEVDINTGEITGGSIGGEVGGFGINISNSKNGRLGVELTYQIGLIEFSVGLGFSPKDSKDPTTPTTPSTSLPPAEQPETKWTPPGGINIESVRGCTLRVSWREVHREINPYSSGCEVYLRDSGRLSTTGYGLVDTKCSMYTFQNPGLWAMYAIDGERHYNNKIDWIIENYRSQEYLDQVISFIYYYGVPSSYTTWLYGELAYYGGGYPVIIGRQVDEPSITVFNCVTEKNPNIYTPPSNEKNTPPPPPFPNPPPRKRNMDECCRTSIKLQRLIVRHLGAERNSSQEVLPEGVVGIGSSQDGIRQAFPFVVKKQWVDPSAKQNETISIVNDRQLTLVLGGMIERLERVLGTAEFYQDSDKKLRQSEGNMLSWLTGKSKDFRYPDPNDFWLSTDDGDINEKVLEVRSIADGLRYQIEALNRLEIILPIAELKDSSIPARWIYSNGKGQLRVGNLIHLCEYMIRKSDKDVGFWLQKVTIKAANPAIKDDEPITTDVHSQADMLRVILQQILDIEGDGDMGRTTTFAGLI